MCSGNCATATRRKVGSAVQYICGILSAWTGRKLRPVLSLCRFWRAPGSFLLSGCGSVRFYCRLGAGRGFGGGSNLMNIIEA